jgi:hypothetical protein
VLPWACLPGRRLGPLHRVLSRIWQYLAKSQKSSGRRGRRAGRRGRPADSGAEARSARAEDWPARPGSEQDGARWSKARNQDGGNLAMSETKGKPIGTV